MNNPVSHRRHFDKIILVEAAGFLAILILSWLDEILEFPKSFFVAHTSNPEAWEGSFETIAILLIAITILVMTQKMASRLFYLERLLKVCAWCRKVNHEGKWRSLEDFFRSGFDTNTTHGMCPECYERFKK